MTTLSGRIKRRISAIMGTQCAIDERIAPLNEEIRRQSEQISQVLKYCNSVASLSDVRYTDIVHQLDASLKLSQISVSSTSSKKKVLILGFYGSQNLGDEFMLETILSYLKADGKKLDLTIMGTYENGINPELSFTYKFLSYPHTRSEYIYLAEAYDALIIGGGAGLDDSHFSEKNSYQYNYPTILLRIANAFIVNNKKVLAVGLSSIRKINDNRYLGLLKTVSESAHHFSVRDPFSKETIEKETKVKVSLVPDIMLANSDVLRANKQTSMLPSDAILEIGIVWICEKSNMDKLKKLIADLAEELKCKKMDKVYQIKLIPFYGYQRNDCALYSKLIDELPQKIKDIAKISVDHFGSSMDDAISIFKTKRVIIAERYHAILLACSLGVYCLPVSYDTHPHYHNKIAYAIEQLGIKQLFCSSSLDTKKLANATISALKAKSSQSHVESRKKNIRPLLVRSEKIIKKTLKTV